MRAMERRTVSTVLLCLLFIVERTRGTPFFFPEPDCYQPTEAPYDAGYGYQRPDYQETLQGILRALQEIVYLTVRVAQEELDQISKLWLPCDTAEYPDGEGVAHEEALGPSWVQGDSTGGAWVQGSTSETSEQNTDGETSTLSNIFGNTSSSTTYSEREGLTNGTRTKITITNTTVVTHKVSGSLGGSSSNGDSNTSLVTDDPALTTSERVEESTTDSYIMSNDTE